MYLIIDKADRIVSISPRICYVKTQSNGTTIMTEIEDATAIYTESDDSFWPLRENTPGERTYRVEEAAQVPEGVEMSALRYEAGEVIADVEKLLETKLTQLSMACRTAIVAGCDVGLSDGSTAHFSLEESDQINLTAAAAAVEQGGTGYPYHADGQLCRLFPAADILTISRAAVTHKLYHTTYCNHVMTWVRRTETAAELAAITYGAKLPEDLAANMEEVLTNAASM